MKTLNLSKENKLRSANKQITISGKKAVKLLAEVEFMMISLRNIEKHYYYNEAASTQAGALDRALETIRVIDEERFIRRLCKVRRLLSEHFDNRVGDDEKGDTERALENLPFWEKPGD